LEWLQPSIPFASNRPQTGPAVSRRYGLRRARDLRGATEYAAVCRSVLLRPNRYNWWRWTADTALR